MDAAGLEVCCPYCNDVFETGKPERGGLTQGRKQPEVESLPYTRDIGRFDPQTARDRTSPTGWTQVCKDFMTFLGFQRIGILRQEPGQPVDVMYRVQYCLGCKRLFDIYANYTPGRSLAQIWPHLFANEPAQQGEIQRYIGISWPIWLSESFSRWLRLPKAEHGAVLMGLFILLIGFLPWIVWGDRTAQGVEPRGLWMTLATYAVAVTGMVALLVRLQRGVRRLQTSDDFYELFRTSSSRGVGYWYNYTLCRFVGVQTQGRLPQISQVEIWGSGLALLSMVLVWAITHLRQINPPLVIGTALVFSALVWLLRKLLVRRRKRSLISILIALVVLFLAVLLTSPDRVDTLFLVSEVIFWSLFAYMAGMAAWVAMSATLYVLKGVTRIPMRISPLTHFKELRPLLAIQQFSTGVMTVLFVTLVSLVFLLAIFSGTLPHLTWMIYWVQLALAVLFAAIAVGLRPVFLLITAVYLALTVYFFSSPALPAAWNIGLSLSQVNLIVFGGFLTFIMYFHIHEGHTYIDKIVATEKDEVLDEIDGQIDKLRAFAARASRGESYGKDKNEFFEYTHGLHGLDALLNLRKSVQVAQFRSANFADRIMGLLLWPIVLPSI